MTYFECVQAIQGYRDPCQDRVEVIENNERTVVIVADGAGGSGNGGLTAEAVISHTKLNVPIVGSDSEWAQILKQVDLQVHYGESTAVVVDLGPFRISGASVGDSKAWIVNDGGITDLTENQQRKPLLGSGNASPVGFDSDSLEGVLLVGSDGFFDYVKPDDVTWLVAQCDFHSIPRRGVELVRLPSGDLWDDTAVVACRVRPLPRTKKRYRI